MSISSIIIVFLFGAIAASIYGAGPLVLLGLSALLAIAWLECDAGQPERVAPRRTT